MASSPAAAAARPDEEADPCALIPHDTLRIILFGRAGGTLDSWSDRPASGRAGCRWEARPRGSGNVRRLTLEVRRFDGDAAAVAELRRRPHNVEDASEALSANADDQLVRPAAFVVEARHAATVALVDASGADLASSPPREVRYRLDAAALAAAGGAVRPAPGFGIDSDVPQLAGDPGAAGGQARPDGASANGWVPAAHAPGRFAMVAEPVVALIAWAASWRFFLIPILIVAGVVLANIVRPTSPRLLRLWRTPLIVGAGAYVLLNIIFGTWLSNALLYHLGQSGSAVITGAFGTSTQYNNHDVMGYNVLIRTAAGRMVRTSFEDDDFNVYPSHNATSYPGVGDRFTVRYLPHFPSRFVIVGNDDSPWAKGLRCAKLGVAADQAERQRDFAGSDPGSARDAVRARAAAAAAGC